MFRLLGFVLGSALSIGALFLLLGLPKLTALSQPDVLENLAPVSEQASDIKQDIAELAEEIVSELPTAIGVQTPAPGEPMDVDLPLEEPILTEAGEEQPGTPEAVSVPEIPATPGEISATLRWQVFWNPFRSEIAANGFVAQLERVTGLDYRVVRVKPGHYEVAFAYLGDADRRTNLSQIEAATGLELSQ